MASQPSPEVFSVGDLRNRSGDLLRDAEAGRLSIITKHGRPAILAVPFGERLLEQGVARSVAISLFESGQTTLAQSAKMADLVLEAFIELLGSLGIPAVDYPPEELADELLAARP
jgi:prevent-host-death family protein